MNYWLHNDNEIVHGEVSSKETLLENVYRVVMKLTIRPMRPDDFGVYKCVAKNSLGESEETITVDGKCFRYVLRNSGIIVIRYLQI